VSIIQAQQRKSYLAPPAPKSLSLKSDSSKDAGSTPKALFNGETPRSAQSFPLQNHVTPTSGEIPLNIPNDVSRDGFYRANTTPSIGRAQVSSLTLEHLSLETNDPSANDTRRPFRAPPGDPQSAIDPPIRPLFPRVSSSNTRMGFYTATLPSMGVASPPASGPPTGPLPAPPTSSSETWRNHPYKVRNDS
jgi:mitogen-activated protein kinase kinase